MRVLMFGWEFPPFNAGGLGVACKGLTTGLSNHGVEVTFVIPKAPEGVSSDTVKLLVASNLKIENLKVTGVDSLLVPYITSEAYADKLMSYLTQKGGKGQAPVYGDDLFGEVHRYGEISKTIAKFEDFDLIHAHDWLTYKAGINAKEVSGKPLVVHVHATEFDRTGGHPNPQIYALEREGMHAADSVITVSDFTKQMVVNHYGVEPEKIHVVHNAVEFERDQNFSRINSGDPLVLFLGRITIQKGPDYFIDAAKKVLDVNPKVKFAMVGSGDMQSRMIDKAASLGILKNVIFTGFLRGADIDRAYKMADVFVMPSISEPFGLVPLEAMRNNTPCIISKTSGVSEVINHCLKVDFWDVDHMANQILSLLKYKPLHKELSENGYEEVHSLNWDDSAAKCIDVYNKTLMHAF